MRTHLVPTGTMPISQPKPKFVPLYLAPRVVGGPAQRSGVSQASSYASIPIFGFNGSPMRSGGTNGEAQIVSRRNVSKFTTV
jgi:hypothetical protein